MKYAITSIFFFCFLTSFGQEKADSLKTETPWTFNKADKFLKFSPLDIISVTPTFGADLEVKFNDILSVQGGIGIVPSFMQIVGGGGGFGDFDRMGGYKLRGEGRFYFNEKGRSYLGAGMSFRHLIIRSETPFGFEPTTDDFGNQSFAYFKNVDMVFNRFNINSEIKYGYQHVTKRNLLFDFYLGLSIRKIKVRSTTSPPEGSGTPNLMGVWTLRDGHSFTYPTPIMGFKVGFKL